MTASAPQSEQAAAKSACNDLCVLAHGMGGTCADWKLWVDVLSARFPSWKVHALESLVAGCRFLGQGFDDLGRQAADEIIKEVNEMQASRAGRLLTLHCMGHSMGGIIIRAALPRILQEVGHLLQLGHYMSLSSPHLGIQAAWTTPSHAWRNLCWFSKAVSSQCVQLSVQDASVDDLPYLVAIALNDSEHVRSLRQFRRRTCVTLSAGDPLIPVSSGALSIIDTERAVYRRGRSCGATFWRFVECIGTDSMGRFEQKRAELQQASQCEMHGAAEASTHAEAAIIGAAAPCCSHDEKPGVPARAGEQWPAVGGCFSWAALCCSRRPSSQARNFACLPWRRSQACPTKPCLVEDSYCPLPHHIATSGSANGAPGSFQSCISESCNGDDVITQPAGSCRRRRKGSGLQWLAAPDGSCVFPSEILSGVGALPWQRIVVELKYFPKALSPHVFLIGKRGEQFSLEHDMSRQCLEQLVEILAE